jgi:hypothetical protein
MTSEVLILNKRAVILGADSAVTTSGGEHPRYSKNANKIFELSKNGNVAAAIYGSASVDLVPWELLLKMFRQGLADAKFPRLSDYSDALCKYLNGNDSAFPVNLREEWISQQFDSAIKEVVSEARRQSPNVVDENLGFEDRQALWKKEVSRIREQLTSKGVAAPLTQAALDALLAELKPWAERAQTQLNEVPTLNAVNAFELAELGHRLRYTLPDLILASTGVVIAGYGEDQIFPAYEQLEIFGHVGHEIFFRKIGNFEVTHTGIPMIQPLAQTSMITMFTDGFGPSLERIINEQGRGALEEVFNKLSASGVVVDEELARKITTECHDEFMGKWKNENWVQNYRPLISVLQSLSVEEMAHLAESLLGLESLKERVTSSSESIGGPIDVAAITKSEGLVWIRRKHFFDAGLNLRYATRLARSLD